MIYIVGFVTGRKAGIKITFVVHLVNFSPQCPIGGSVKGGISNRDVWQFLPQFSAVFGAPGEFLVPVMAGVVSFSEK